MRAIGAGVFVVLVALYLGEFTPSRADQKFTCPVTTAGAIDFEPPPSFAGHDAELFGSAKLFTLFPGNWHTTQQSELGYRVPKIVWGTAESYVPALGPAEEREEVGSFGD